MDSRARLLAAWSFQETDRVPIELDISPAAYEFSEAERIVEFIDKEADNIYFVPAADWGFFGLQASYSEEVIEDVPQDFRRIKRTYSTRAGDFHAITKHKHHKHDEFDPGDFHWERRFIHTIEDMKRLAEAPREAIPLDKEAFDKSTQQVGDRRLLLVDLFHPLGWLVRQANMEEVYGWLHLEPTVIHQFLQSANQQVAETVLAMAEIGIGPYFAVTAHEMLIPPWMGPDMFDEFVFTYDKTVNDTIHRVGGKLRAHCHGNCMNYLEKMSRMGIDAIEPLEPPPFGDVSLGEAKRLVGSRMLLSGNIPSQNFLRMTRGEVRQSVQEAICAAGRGGGFTLRTTGGYAGTGSIQDKAQMLKVFDNIEAYMEAALEFGAYPLKSAQ